MKKLLHSHLLLLPILALALALRLYGKDNPIADWHSWRQADTASVARNFVKNGIDLLHPTYDDLSNIASGKDNPAGYRFAEFPVSQALHALLAKAFSGSDFNLLGRLLSVFFSLITITTLYFLVNLEIGPLAALVTSLVLSTMPFNVFYSRVILPEPLIIALSTSFFLFISLYFKHSKFRFWALSVLCFSLLLTLKAYMGVLLIPPLFLGFKKYGLKILKQKLFWGLLVAFIPFLVWYWWARHFPEGIPNFSWAFNSDKIRFRPSFFYWIFSQRIGTLILGVWGVALFVQGLLDAFQKRLYLFLLWFFSLLVFFSVVATANVRHDYYQAIATPVIAVFVSLGLLSFLRQSFARQLVSLLVLALMLVTSAREIKGYYQINHPEIVTAGKRADEILPQVAKIVAPYMGDTAFLYQTKRQGWPLLTHDIEELVKKGATHYISVNFDEETKKIMAKYTVIEKTNAYVIVDLSPNRKAL